MNCFARIIISASIATLMACSPQSPEDKTLNYAAQTVSSRLQNWQTQSATLATLAADYCNNNPEKKIALPQLQEQWQKTRQSWQLVQALPVGKLNEQSQFWQVHFWPDKKNLVQFQFIKLMQSPQQTIDMDKTSAVLRGLGASEYLLFDPIFQPDSLPNRQTRCILLTANTAFQKNLSTQFDQDWQQQGKHFTTFPNPTFASQTDALGELLRSEISAMEVWKAQFGAPLPPRAIEKATADNTPLSSRSKPFEAVFWRSDASLDSFKQGLAAHENLWKNDGWELLISQKNPELTKQINDLYAKLHQLSDSLNKPLRELLKSDDNIKTLHAIRTELGVLEKAYGEGIAKTLGVQIGFNANDGD